MVRLIYEDESWPCLFKNRIESINVHLAEMQLNTLYTYYIQFNTWTALLCGSRLPFEVASYGCFPQEYLTLTLTALLCWSKFPFEVASYWHFPPGYLTLMNYSFVLGKISLCCCLRLTNFIMILDTFINRSYVPGKTCLCGCLTLTKFTRILDSFMKCSSVLGKISLICCLIYSGVASYQAG